MTKTEAKPVTSFKPGVSGNPGGRPNKPTKIDAGARAAYFEAQLAKARAIRGRLEDR